MNQLAPPDNVLEVQEVMLSSARGGRKATEDLLVEVLRPLTPEDMPNLQNPAPQPVQGLSIQKMRYAHHRIAQLLAEGRDNEDVALITGYSPSYISSLKGGLDFQNLLDYYSQQRDQVFVDTLERMKQLGLASLEELQERLADDPNKFTTQQLQDMVELLLVKGPVAKAQVNASLRPAVAATLNVRFVTAPQAGQVIDQPSQPRRITNIEPGA